MVEPLGSLVAPTVTTGEILVVIWMVALTMILVSLVAACAAYAWRRRGQVSGEVLDALLKQYQAALEELHEVKRELKIAATVIEDMEQRVKAMEEQVATTARAALRRLRIVGAWVDLPDMPALNLEADRDSVLASSGLGELASLTGTVTRQAIMDELARYPDGVDVLYIASHATADHVRLSEGQLATPVWLIQIAQRAGLKLVVLNGCSTLSIADALHSRGRGVPAVVAIRGLWPDADAIDFARVFFRELAAGESVQRAVSRARLSLDSDQAAALVAVQGDYQWLQPPPTPPIAPTQAPPRPRRATTTR